MIKSVKIQNFQSHAKTELEFAPGVNVIVGTSDSGKTAIIRALRWVSWNRPSGDALRSTWGGLTNVTIKTEEGEVLRSKDKADRYEYHPSGAERALEFKAFGTNVPQEIATFLNLNEINIQHQLDAPFLLSETPGGVATHFNKVAKLDKIDTATSAINGWLRGLKSDIDHLETDIDSEKEKLESFTHLDRFEADLEVLEALTGDLSVLQSRQESLKKDIRKCRALEEHISTFEDFVSLEDLVIKTLALVSQRDEERKQYGNLSKIIKQLTAIQEDEDSITHLLTAEPLVDDMIEKFAKVKALQSDYTKLKSLMDQIDQCQSDIGTIETNIETSEELFNKEMGDTCILCGQSIKKK